MSVGVGEHSVSVFCINFIGTDGLGGAVPLGADVADQVVTELTGVGHAAPAQGQAGGRLLPHRQAAHPVPGGWGGSTA